MVHALLQNKTKKCDRTSTPASPVAVGGANAPTFCQVLGLLSDRILDQIAVFKDLITHGHTTTLATQAVETIFV